MNPRASVASDEPAAASGASQKPLDASVPQGRIQGLVPRTSRGIQFVTYSDCCSGIPGHPSEESFRKTNDMVARLQPRPAFIAFPGDAIRGLTTDYAEVRRQWRYFKDVEMKWAEEAQILLLMSTSNHETYDLETEEIFRETFPDIPKNGPGDQQGLAYHQQIGDLLYISLHHPDRSHHSGLYRPTLDDSEWLDGVLLAHRDVPFKVVAGHYPAFPANGYSYSRGWILTDQERDALWRVLVRHKVNLYLASHLILFDVQVREGVLHVISGGAGNPYGPGGRMPARTEYFHAVQFALDEDGIRYQVVDQQGAAREVLTWPFELPERREWISLESMNEDPPSEAAWIANAQSPLVKTSDNDLIGAWNFRGVAPEIQPEPQTLLAGWLDAEGAPVIWIGIEAHTNRLLVTLVPELGYGSQSWHGPVIETGAPFYFDLVLHPGMGPGGVLCRDASLSGPWSSLGSPSPKGAEDLTWPRRWYLARGQDGPEDTPFLGNGLVASYVTVTIPDVL